LRSHTWIKGEWTDDLLFGLLADEWLRPAGPPVSGRRDRPGGAPSA